MKDLKKPLGAIFMVIGAVCFIFGIGIPTLMAPLRGSSMSDFGAGHVVLMAVGVLMGMTGLLVLLSQSADGDESK